MNSRLFLAGAIVAAFAACNTDVTTATATGPGAAFCEESCSCDKCSSNELESCSENITDLSEQASDAGCDAEFKDYVGCINALKCQEGAVDDSGCSAQFTLLDKCTNPNPGCATVDNDVCDEPEGTGTCPEGTDAADCGDLPTCATLNNGVCDEPEGTGTCPEGTDLADCEVPPPPCTTLNNGVCDEPEGTATCPEGSDVADCAVMPDECSAYCQTIIENCTGASAQYASTESCLATCAAFPLGMAGDTSGNSVGCRAYHAGAAKFDPLIHCVHAGPSGGAICGDYCESFCGLVQVVCAGGNAVYPTAKECMYECTMFPNSEPYDASDTAGDSLSCRVYHATIAAVDPATHCPHVTQASAVCQ